MKDSIIVAVCGDSGAGKSTTTGLLTEAGYRAFSLSGFLRDEAEAAFEGPSRAQVQAHGKKMQQDHGNDYFARRLVAETDLIAPGDAVIDGMRNLDEVAYVRTAAQAAGATFVLLAVVLDAKRRFDRVQGRRRAGDPADLETFKIDDARANGADGAFQNNAALVAAADICLVNDGDIATLSQNLHAGLAGTTRRTSAAGGADMMTPLAPAASFDRRCARAREIVREAGLHARSAFLDRGSVTVSTKGTQDWVTNVDLDVEALIRRRLAESFPGEAILGEENGIEPGLENGPLWVIDPIDGTTCFLLGVPQWCVVLAHVVRGAPQVAAIYDPMADELYHAIRGGGAFCNGRPIHAASATSFSQGLISVGASQLANPARSADFMQELVENGGMYLRIGACALALCYVASGRLLAMHEPLVSPWDDLAGLLMVQEAGGRTSAIPERIEIGRRHPVTAAAPAIWPDVEPLA